MHFDNLPRWLAAAAIIFLLASILSGLGIIICAQFQVTWLKHAIVAFGASAILCTCSWAYALTFINNDGSQ